MREVPQTQTWLESEGEEIRVGWGEREEEKNVLDGGGSERRLESTWCILGNQSAWQVFLQRGEWPC